MPGQPGGASRPVLGSMPAHSIPAGAWADRGCCGRAFISWVKMGSAPLAPVSLVGWLSSRPTQTTASRSAEKPANQLSRRSLVVPVLPASCSPGRALPSAAAVPSRTVPCMAWVTRKVGAGWAAWRTVSA